MTTTKPAPIYLDNHATTPMDERVFMKMKPFFLTDFGNPASKDHSYGWRAQEAVDEARIAVARAINAHPTEIIFTSGATESINMALKGFLRVPDLASNHQIISSSIEHSATTETILKLGWQSGVQHHFVKPHPDGHVETSAILAALTPSTKLVSLFFVHNEIGSINDIKEIARHLKAKNILFHCDAAQALGRIEIDFQTLGVDMMSFSGHKVYGPKGSGFLCLSRAVQEQFFPLIHGGGQEWGLRSGTLNVPGIVGLGEAARLAVRDLQGQTLQIKSLRDRLWNNLKTLNGVHLNGSMNNRVAGNLSVAFAGIDGEELLLAICQTVALSTASACRSSHGGTSTTLKELGVAPNLRHSTLRFGVGRFNTEVEIDTVSQIIVETVKKLRGEAPPKLVKLSRGK
jgi:cysteine desulfurase